MFGTTGSPFEFKRERSSISEEIIGKIGKLNMENKFDESSLLRDIFNHVKNNTTTYKYWSWVRHNQGHTNDRTTDLLPDNCLVYGQTVFIIAFLCSAIIYQLHYTSFLFFNFIKYNLILYISMFLCYYAYFNSIYKSREGALSQTNLSVTRLDCNLQGYLSSNGKFL